MDSAVCFGRDRVLASCEHCIVMDHLERFNHIIPYMPPESLVRIVECLRQGVYAREQKTPWYIPWTTEEFLSHKLKNSFKESSTATGSACDWDMEV